MLIRGATHTPHTHIMFHSFRKRTNITQAHTHLGNQGLVLRLLGHGSQHAALRPCQEGFDARVPAVLLGGDGRELFVFCVCVCVGVVVRVVGVRESVCGAGEG